MAVARLPLAASARLRRPRRGRRATRTIRAAPGDWIEEPSALGPARPSRQRSRRRSRAGPRSAARCGRPSRTGASRGCFSPYVTVATTRTFAPIPARRFAPFVSGAWSACRRARGAARRARPDLHFAPAWRRRRSRAAPRRAARRLEIRAARRGGRARGRAGGIEEPRAGASDPGLFAPARRRRRSRAERLTCGSPRAPLT
jgi:hypothetical protein